MQEISDREFIAMLHQLPDKAAYINYLKALAASARPAARFSGRRWCIM